MKHVYLPSIHNGEAVQGQGDMNGCATAFAEEWLKQLGERASVMHFDSRLAQAAQAQADFLATNDFVPEHPHQGAGGSMPNDRVRAAGYKLPDYYPAKANQVESATHSWDIDMAEVVADLMAHPTHHEHMWGLGWFADHIVYGVGCAGNYFVCVTAPIEEM